MSIFIFYSLTLFGLAGSLEWVVTLGNFLGLFLLGAAFISIGMFISCMTENQVVAAILSFIINMLLYQLDMFASGVTNTVVQKIMVGIGFYTRYSEFTAGILSTPTIVFFLSVIFIFNFLTVRVLERRRWA
jgi:ABC-2 type transport system permease protein